MARYYYTYKKSKKKTKKKTSTRWVPTALFILGAAACVWLFCILWFNVGVPNIRAKRGFNPLVSGLLAAAKHTPKKRGVFILFTGLLRYLMRLRQLFNFIKTHFNGFPNFRRAGGPKHFLLVSRHSGLFWGGVILCGAHLGGAAYAVCHSLGRNCTKNGGIYTL